MNLPENYQEILTGQIEGPVMQITKLPEQNSEMQWAEELENLVLKIKENIHFRDEKNRQLENIQPEIDELLVKLADKQTEEERIKAEIITAEEECAQYKERLFEASSR